MLTAPAIFPLRNSKTLRGGHTLLPDLLFRAHNITASPQIRQAAGKMRSKKAIDDRTSLLSGDLRHCDNDWRRLFLPSL